MTANGFLGTSGRDGTRHHVAGGLEHGGGISRLVGYVQAAGGADAHRVVDTRGARFRPVGSALRLAGAIAAVACDRVIRPGRLQQLHIAGRGSTLRKLVLGAVARGLGSAYVLHLHDYDYARDLSRRPPWLRAAIGRLFRGARHVLVLGRRDAATIRALGVPPERITVLHNAVPTPDARAPRRDGPVRILFLGQLGPRKGVPELLRALADPSMHALDWRAVLAGDGPVEAYRDEARRLGLASRVTLTGWLAAPEAARLLRGADVLVLPSHGEGMAMAVLEGLAHGLAVVTTPVGAHPEVLTDGVDCRLVPPGDAGALARTLAELVADPEARASLGRAARALHERALGLEGYLGRLDAALDTARPGAGEAAPAAP